MVAPIPLHKVGDTGFNTGRGGIAQVPADRGDIGIGGGHIARLHRLEIDQGLAATGLFQQADDLHQVFAAAVADVVDAVRLHAAAGLFLPIVGRRIVQAGHHPGDDIVDMGEIAPHLTLVEHRDRFARQNLLREDPQHHIVPPPRAIDSEEPQTRLRQAIEVGIAFADQLIRALGGGVERDGVIAAILNGEGQLGIAAIDRAGTGIDHVLHLPVPREFQQVEVPHQVRLDIGVRVFDRIAHPGLGTEVDHAVDLLTRQRGIQRGHVGKVDPVKREAITRLFRQRGEPVLLQADGVVIVEVINPDHAVPPGNQRPGQVKANKAGRAG